MSVTPDEVNPILEKYDSSPMKQGDKLQKVLSRPDVTLADFESIERIASYIKENDLNEEEKNLC